jgi:hypothetical protein
MYLEDVGAVMMLASERVRFLLVDRWRSTGQEKRAVYLYLASEQGFFERLCASTGDIRAWLWSTDQKCFERPCASTREICTRLGAIERGEFEGQRNLCAQVGDRCSLSRLQRTRRAGTSPSLVLRLCALPSRRPKLLITDFSIPLRL